MPNRIFNFLASLRLTVVLLSLAMVLVFVGTLAQVKLGLWVAQEEYFQSLFIWWGPAGADWKIPVFPGGYFLGWALLINLIAAHLKRFDLSRKKAGMFMIHGGLILLLLGQFFTELFQVESNMRLEEGETKNYSESVRANELVVIDVTDPKEDKVVSIPESYLASHNEIRHQELPFTIKVKEYFPNSEPVKGAPKEGEEAVTADQGVGKALSIVKKPITAKMDDRNIPAAKVEIEGEKGSPGEWMVSNWVADNLLVGLVGRQFGADVQQALAQPQQFTYDGRTYQVALRFKRYYKPYSIRLVDFTHDRYKGTEIPKNFSSRVHLHNFETGEDRDVLIYMNNPLRYGGETYYQGGFEPGDTVSVLQVVRNPAYVTPYVACVLVGAGLLVQFLMHLIGFSRRVSKFEHSDNTRPRELARHQKPSKASAAPEPVPAGMTARKEKRA